MRPDESTFEIVMPEAAQDFNVRQRNALPGKIRDVQLVGKMRFAIGLKGGRRQRHSHIHGNDKWFWRRRGLRVFLLRVIRSLRHAGQTARE
jgi:hypothetical protein